MKTDIPYTEVQKEAPEPIFQLTVVTVCWNALADLKPTVESVLRQKAKGSISIEHLVVDGASTDGTPEWLAEQLAAGNIERYVSEPDRGIYDAMNKGINLARGHVLAFLNAGDTYTDEDLAACVLPICNGETQSVAAYTRFLECEHWDMRTVAPDYSQVFLRMPCNHPSLFAAAALYRSLGGYDTRYVCSADSDIAYRMYRETGSPVVLKLYTTDFAPGGLSSDCVDKFRHEILDIQWSNWDLAMAKCREDRDFKIAQEALLVTHCREFQDWQERHGRAIPETLGELREMCIQMSKTAHSLYARLALRFFAYVYLPDRIKGKRCSSLMCTAAKFWAHACYIPEGNAYKACITLHNSPLSANPLFFFLR